MKGPFERLKYDLRRIWECPRCGAKQRTDGAVTTRFCQCGKPNTNLPVAMKLISDGPRRTVPPIAPPVFVADSAPSVEPAQVTQVEVIAIAPEIAAAPIVDVITPPPDKPAESSP